MAKEQQKKIKYFEGVGRRKTAVARIRIYPEEKKGEVLVNNRPSEEYFKIDRQKKTALKPLVLVNFKNKMAATAKVEGGGLNAQAGAVSLALARALVKYDEKFRPVLKTEGLLTRDSRMVERKKYGLKKARRAPQWAKR